MSMDREKVKSFFINIPADTPCDQNLRVQEIEPETEYWSDPNNACVTFVLACPAAAFDDLPTPEKLEDVVIYLRRYQWKQKQALRCGLLSEHVWDESMKEDRVMDTNKEFYSCLCINARTLQVRERFTMDIWDVPPDEKDEGYVRAWETMLNDPETVVLMYCHEKHKQLRDLDVVAALREVVHTRQQEYNDD